MADEPNLVIVSPTSVDGKPARIVTYPDGKVIVQLWTKSGWETDTSRVVSEKKPEPKKAGGG